MLAFTPLVTDGLISRRSSGYVSPRSSPLSSSTLWREVGIRRVQRPSQTRRCFEGVPPNPPPGFYGEGEWDDFNEEEKMSWNPLAIYQKVSRFQNKNKKSSDGEREEDCDARCYQRSLQEQSTSFFTSQVGECLTIFSAFPFGGINV